MNKDAERRLIEEVYPAMSDWAINPSESPDFLCGREDQILLGIEVTDYYYSERDARLRMIPHYAKDLISEGKYRHKDDKNDLKVECIKYLKGGEEPGIEIDAIVRRPPPLNDLVAQLATKIHAKNEKCDTYLCNAPLCDLIINDVTNVFHFDQFCDIYKSIARSSFRRAIIPSKFREIFLVTKNGGGRVCVPLRTNLFAEEIAIAEHLYRKHAETTGSCTESCGVFAVIVAALCEVGFGSARVQVQPEHVSFYLANVEFSYTATGKQIRNHICDPMADVGDLVSEIYKTLTEKHRVMANDVLRERKEYSATLDLFFAVHQEDTKDAA